MMQSITLEANMAEGTQKIIKIISVTFGSVDVFFDCSFVKKQK